MLTIALVARGEEDSDAASASAPVKAFTTRSVPSTVSSILALICSKSVRANGFIEGKRKGIVHDDVHPPVLGKRGSDQLVDRIVVGDIGGHDE